MAEDLMTRFLLVVITLGVDKEEVNCGGRTSIRNQATQDSTENRFISIAIGIFERCE
jgi:hypothetical protein